MGLKCKEGWANLSACLPSFALSQSRAQHTEAERMCNFLMFATWVIYDCVSWLPARRRVMWKLGSSGRANLLVAWDGPKYLHWLDPTLMLLFHHYEHHVNHKLWACTMQHRMCRALQLEVGMSAFGTWPVDLLKLDLFQEPILIHECLISSNFKYVFYSYSNKLLSISSNYS